MHSREERLAMNEVLFRKANDRIETSADQQDRSREPVAFFCECSDRDCVERIEISPDEFDSARAAGLAPREATSRTRGRSCRIY